MRYTLLAVPLLLGFAPPPQDSLKPGEMERLEAAKAAAGNDADELASLALWCEARGLDKDRAALLAEAVEADPQHPTARGLMGQTEHDGRWETPEQAAERIEADEALAAKLAEYDTLREKLDRLIDYEAREGSSLEQNGLTDQARDFRALVDRKLAPEHIRLGLWCEQNGLDAEALAHFTAAVRLDPYDDTTWRHLGYIRYQGRWMSHEQVAAAKSEEAAQRHADRHWEPLLRKWGIHLDDPKTRAEALAQFDTVTDPRAVPSIMRLFADLSPAGQELAIRLLGQILAPESTKQLGALALYGATAQIRHDAALALRGREPRGYADALVHQIHTPWTYAAQPPLGPGTEGYLVVDSLRFHLTRSYKAPAPFHLDSSFHGYYGYGPDGLPSLVNGFDLSVAFSHPNTSKGVRREIQALRDGEERFAELIATANLRSELARERLMLDINDIEMFNAQAVERNRRVSEALVTALDAPADLRDDDEDGWLTWYYETIGYRYTAPPKETLAMDATPTFRTPVIVSCFAAGTPVLTTTGPRPIETLRVGDQVLSQDVTTGGLSYEPILAVHHNPPDATLRVALANGDEVIASRFHRFWVAGRGWSMARDLSTGDLLRSLSGPERITAIDTAPVQPVYNLDVAHSRTYFVGRSSMLVHDNTLPPPHPDAPAFDRVPSLAASGR